MGNTYVGVTSRLEWDDENVLAARKENVGSDKNIMLHLRNYLWVVDVNFL